MLNFNFDGTAYVEATVECGDKAAEDVNIDDMPFAQTYFSDLEVALNVTVKDVGTTVGGTAVYTITFPSGKQTTSAGFDRTIAYLRGLVRQKNRQQAELNKKMKQFMEDCEKRLSQLEMAYYKHPHRDDSPAKDCTEDSKFYCKNNPLHRENGPKIEDPADNPLLGSNGGRYMWQYMRRR